MNYTGPVFRPPIERDTVLLQVTVGCAHNKCTFCTMYKSVQFKTASMEQIEADLEEAKGTFGSLKRLFLVNGDAFVLSADKLKVISDKIIDYFPEIEVITMYASIRNILTKTDEELMMLKEARINDLWIGLETGTPDVLAHLNKGYTMEQAYSQLHRLNKANIRHNAILMLGAAGIGKSVESSDDGAALINATKPSVVGVTPLGLFEGSHLAEEAKKGLFVPATERNILEEEKLLIEKITVDNIPFYGDHPLNAARVNGLLPADKEPMIQSLETAIKSTDEALLDSTRHRNNL